MRKIVILETLDAGADVLLVRGTVDGAQVEARGWLSATTNHYSADAYKADGSRKSGAKPRRMTAAEARAYCARLLEAAAPIAPPAPAAVKLF